MSDAINSSHLLVTLSKDNLYPKLIEQLNKDFRLAGVNEEFSSSIQPENLHNYLHKVVHDIINNQFSDYLNLLYRIDISESKLSKLDGSNLEELSNQVSYLILKRECQKVLFKNRL